MADKPVMPKVDDLDELRYEGMSYWYLDKGDGEKPDEGDTLTVHYSGWLESGDLFDSSKLRGDAFCFDLGGPVIDGWNLILSQLKVGDRVLVKIPPEKGYGSQSVGSIPPDSTLFFEIEFLDSF